MSDFKKLSVWEKAHLLTLGVYKSTEGYPRTEVFGLTSQMRRASSSIGCNIAEGLGRGSDGELARFLRIAIGSANELEYQLLLSRDLKYLSCESFERLQRDTSEVGRMLTGFLHKVEQRVQVRNLPRTQHLAPIHPQVSK